jgi:hypothetical protein
VVPDYFIVTRDASGKVVALEEFPNGEEPPIRLLKLDAPLASGR